MRRCPSPTLSRFAGADARSLVGGTLGAPALLAGGLLLIAAITSTTLCTGVGQVLGGLKQTGKLTPDVSRAINEESARFDVDPYVVGALAMRETAGGTAVSCSSAGACGVMQLMPAFWAGEPLRRRRRRSHGDRRCRRQRLRRDQRPHP